MIARKPQKQWCNKQCGATSTSNQQQSSRCWLLDGAQKVSTTAVSRFAMTLCAASQHNVECRDDTSVVPRRSHSVSCTMPRHAASLLLDAAPHTARKVSTTAVSRFKSTLCAGLQRNVKCRYDAVRESVAPRRACTRRTSRTCTHTDVSVMFLWFGRWCSAAATTLLRAREEE